MKLAFSKGANHAARIIELMVEESKRSGSLSRGTSGVETSAAEVLKKNLMEQNNLVENLDLSDPLVQDELIRLSNELQHKIINGR